MREHLANHTFGFYLSISAGILSVVSLLFYLGADNQGAAVLPLIVCSILAEVAGIAINRFTGKAGVLMLIPTVNALLFSAAIILSIIPQVDSLGYLVSGLYSFEDMKAFILYAVFAILTWLWMHFMGKKFQQEPWLPLLNIRRLQMLSAEKPVKCILT